MLPALKAKQLHAGLRHILHLYLYSNHPYRYALLAILHQDLKFVRINCSRSETGNYPGVFSDNPHDTELLSPLLAARKTNETEPHPVGTDFYETIQAGQD
jgi:hypothetical protein